MRKLAWILLRERMSKKEKNTKLSATKVLLLYREVNSDPTEKVVV